ncbi:RadC family protein [Pikeienuella sp. HZG-20]|uniref:RadC family protein n=1 Tax=Paludibacillus litoralis TaxID=3133267 RepID=UPI0030EC1F3A
MFGRWRKPERPVAAGFSEQALRDLEALEARTPPPEIYERIQGEAARPSGGPPPGKRPHYWGHRERLRQRFLKSAGVGQPDYEILELILFNAISRIDVKPLAKQLLAEFGDLNGVISAPAPRLLRMEGVTEKVVIQFRLAEAVAARLARAKVIDRSVIASWAELMTYCKTVMAHREIEQFRVLFLDRKNVLIADEEQARGTVDHVPVYPREVAKRALEVNASAIILLHNHPSGDPTPSGVDVEMTERICAACEAVGVTVHDHVVIGKETDASFRELGLL